VHHNKLGPAHYLVFMVVVGVTAIVVHGVRGQAHDTGAPPRS